MIDDELEVERYELRERPAYRFVELPRRAFLRGLAGGLLIALLLPAARGEAAPPGERRRGGRNRSGGGGAPEQLGAWIRIAEDQSVTVFTGKVEVGQGIRTSLSQVVAEQLKLAPERITLIMGDTQLTPYDRGTHGSQSTPRMGPQLQAVAATAREVLLGLAAARWEVDTNTLELADGAVVESGGERRSLSFGELAGAGELTAVVEPELGERPLVEPQVIGRSIPKLRARDIVTGAHAYTSDLQLPGLVHGKILRAPAFEARRTALDTAGARELAGVTVIEDGDLVGVVAPNPAEADRALKQITAEWERTEQTNSDALFDYLVEHPGEGSGRGGRGPHEQGSVDAAIASAAHVVEARYTIPYIAHAPLEPRAAVARWNEAEDAARLEVWVGTQHPFSVRDDLAEAFGLEPDEVRVRVPDTGSGYGGKHTSEVALEAARLAKSAGAPVKLVWTREEEFTWAYFRPAGVMDLRASLDPSGKLTGWSHVNYNSGGSALDTPYVVANRDVRFQATQSPLRQGSYRGLAATANHFARESHMDELAHVAEIDPLEFRRRHLDDPRLRGVLDVAADRFDWSRPRPKRHGFGLGLGTDKGGYVATFAEVAVDDAGALTVLRLVTAFECGRIVNPSGPETQVEGGVIMGLGGALFEAIEFGDGEVRNPRFSRYRVPRITDMPQLETVLVDRPDLPSAGAGETPICCVAPAIANAIFAASGRRLRQLPLTRDGVLAPG